MGHSKWNEIRRSKVRSPEDEADVEAMKAAMLDAQTIGDLRDSVGVTQTELASRLGVSQSSVSQLERRREVYLSTLREYVEALGGELEVAAVFPGGPRIRIRTEEPARVAEPA